MLGHVTPNHIHHRVHVRKSLKGIELAEREGFEPPVPVKARTLSRRLVSTTHPSLRVVVVFEFSNPNFIRSKLQFTESSPRHHFLFQVCYRRLVHHCEKHRLKGSCIDLGRSVRVAAPKLRLYIDRVAIRLPWVSSRPKIGRAHV